MKMISGRFGLSTLALVGAIASSGIIALAGAQPHLVNAKTALNTAAFELNASGGDTAGHTASALDHVRQALAELKMACGAECADPTPKPGTGGIHKGK
jgi:hypothetical protein